MHEIRHGEAVSREIDELRAMAVLFIQRKLSISGLIAELRVNNTLMIYNLLVDYARYIGFK